MKKLIVLSGCDDHTDIPIDLTEEQIALIEKICELSENNSEYGCMPVMRLEDFKECDE